jgi:hypothetical protein
VIDSLSFFNLLLRDNIKGISLVKLIVGVGEREVDSGRGTLPGELGVPNKGILDITLLVVLVVDVGHTEASAVSVGPLEVVQKGPAEVGAQVHSIESHCIDHVLDVTLVEVNSELIVDSVGDLHFVLTWDTDTVLEDVNCGVVVSIGNPINNSSDTLRYNV